MTNNKKLIIRLKNGDNSAFDAFYENTKRGVYFVIRKLTNDSCIIEDVMQDSYLTFLDKIKEINDNENYFAYLLTIARNKTINYLKKINKVELTESIDVFAEPSFNKEAPLLHYCKQNLSETEWFLLEMCVINGFKRVEVATLLEKSISTINWQYHQMLKKVKKFYKEVY